MENFGLAIKAVLRQNPDIILIGEMRDRETFETAISAAETGHLVFSTMHAATVAQSLTRLFEFFPPEEQLQARRAIAGSLRGFICQKLIPALEGGGRMPTNEILHADATVKNLILEGQFEKIQLLLESSGDSSSVRSSCSMCSSDATRATAASCVAIGTRRLSIPKVMFWRTVMVG